MESKTDVQDHSGAWVLDGSENFDELLKAFGVGWAKRKVIKLFKPKMEIEQDGLHVKITQHTPKGDKVVEHDIGDEYDDKNMEGDDVHVVTKLEEDGSCSSVTTNKAKGVDMAARRYLEGDKLVLEITFKDVACKRIFKRAK